MLTVREILADAEVGLLAGEAGLDVPVRWVHISELLDPTPWLSGGELLLTTGLALDGPDRQRQYIATLADHGLAGLGLGTGFTHDTVPQALIEAAAERDFPLFEVPYEVPFIALTEQAFTRLVNEQYALLQRSIAAQERLQRIVLGERGLEAIVGALANLIGGAALVFDGRGELHAQRTFRRELPAQVVSALGDELRERARRGDGRGFAPAHPDLAPGALAVVDCWLPDAEDLARYDGRVVLEWVREEPGTGRTVTKTGSATWDPTTSTVRLTTVFEAGDPGEPAVRWVRVDNLRLVSPDELVSMAEAAGLRVEALAGDYDLGPLELGAERVVLLARRS